jgi:HlyD family secretion protein
LPMPSLDLPNRPAADSTTNSLARPATPAAAKAAAPASGNLRTLFIVAVAGVAVAVGYGLWKRFAGDGGVDPALFQTEKVEKRDIRIVITEDGNVESASNIDLKCRIEGGSQILTIIPDGTHVTKGTKLVTLSSAAIDEKITAQQIVVERGKAALFQAAEDLAVAEIALKEYLEGTYIKDLQTAKSAVVVQEQNVKTAENLFNHTESMFRKGHVNQLQLDANRDGVTRAKLDLEAAKTAEKLLVEFTKPKMTKQLESARDNAKSKLEAEKRAFQLEKDKLERLEEQKKQCIIVAPQDGTVIYANQEGNRGNQQILIEEGAQMKEFQTILRLPDLSKMQVKAMVHESKVGRIRPGMVASVKIRDQEAKGEVTMVMSQAETQWGSSVKSYATYVAIKDSKAFSDLKPNMTAQVTVLIKELKNVLAVPLQAVVEKGGKFFCYIRTDRNANGYEERQVMIGDNNDKHIEVKDGLAIGDLVILNPRATCPEARESIPEPDSSAELEMPAGVPSPDLGPPGVSPGKGPGGKGKGKGKNKGIGPDGVPLVGGPPMSDDPTAGGNGGPGPGGPPGGPGGKFDPSKIDPKKLEEWKRKKAEGFKGPPSAAKPPEKTAPST